MSSTALESPIIDSCDEYVTRTVRSWLGIPASSNIAAPLLPDRLRALFLRTEETSLPYRDQWGQWEHTFSDNYWRGMLWRPEVDEWLSEQRRDLERQGVPLIPLWPAGKSFAVCLTHDVDTLGPSHSLSLLWRRLTVARPYQTRVQVKATFHALAGYVESWVRRMALRSKEPVHTIDQCYQIERELGVKASYFCTVYPIVGRPAPFDCVYRTSDAIPFNGRLSKIRDVLCELADQGGDVGLHGSIHSATEPGALLEQKEFLERVLGGSIHTTRQHWLTWDPLTTPRLQARAGLSADSTLGFNRSVGFRCGTSLPFYLRDASHNRTLPVLELPMVFQEAAVHSAQGLEYSNHQTRQLYSLLLGRLLSVGGCLTLLYHPDNKFCNSEIAGTYRWMIERALAEGAWVTNLKEVSDWWQQREKILQNS